MAAVLAFALRLDSGQLQPYVRTMLIYALAAPLIQIPIFAALGLYSRFWRYASIDELLLLAWAALIGGLAQGALFFGIQALFPDLLNPGVPRSIPLIAILLTLVVIAAPRFALLLWSQNSRRSAKANTAPPAQQRVLIAGAGEAGALILRELRANPQTGLIPVGFVDDDPHKHGMLIQRVRVLGGREAIPALVREHQVDQVIIAMPAAPGSAVREIVDICEQAGVRARIIPGMYELLSGAASIGQLRDVQIEDLLRREPVQTDTAQVAALIRGRRVLVTGAGGSIGSELCRQIVRCEPAELIILGHGENSIFDIHNELQRTGSWKLEAARPNVQTRSIQHPASSFHVHARHRRHPRRRPPGRGVRGAPAGDRLPRGRAQARAADGRQRRGRRDQQRAGDPAAGGSQHRGRGGSLRAHLHRQGGESQQRDGRDQARGRADRAGGGAAHRPRVRGGALRQRAGQPRQRGAVLPAADRGGRAGHRHPPRHASATS